MRGGDKIQISSPSLSARPVGFVLVDDALFSIPFLAQLARWISVRLTSVAPLITFRVELWETVCTAPRGVAIKRGTSGGLSEIYLSVCVCVCVCRQSRLQSLSQIMHHAPSKEGVGACSRFICLPSPKLLLPKQGTHCYYYSSTTRESVGNVYCNKRVPY